MLLRSNPAPPTTYGRTPPPCEPPTGTPTTTLPIRVVTLLSPNAKLAGPVVFWKKFGDQPQSSSAPAIPFPIQPSDAPRSTRRSTSSSKLLLPPKLALPLKLPPTNGVRYQSADARRGAAPIARTASVAMKNSLRTRMYFPPVITADVALKRRRRFNRDERNSHTERPKIGLIRDRRPRSAARCQARS